LKRNIYLNKLTLKEAKDKFNKILSEYKLNQPSKGELIFTNDSLGRITAEPIFAKISSPYYQSAAMDGVVVKAKDTYGASESSPIKLKINHNFHFINTGNPIPRGFDAVIKIEDINIIDKIASGEPVKPEEKRLKYFLPLFRGNIFETSEKI